MEKNNTQPELNQEAKTLSEEEWKSKLSTDQYRILRQAGTERPFGDIYNDFKNQGKGNYYCAGCGSLLFSSGEKFDSGCGWPSFWDPAESNSVKLRSDDSLGVRRTEVVCATCEGHLGHVFSGEGFETPTDQRYCINGSILVYVPSPSE